MAKKGCLWVYAVALLVVVAPGYLVWALLPDIAAKTEKGRERQLITLFSIAALPLIVILIRLMSNAVRARRL